ncbi:hypothetical protein VTO73DRAFT_15046 [Trametes versicolor]
MNHAHARRVNCSSALDALPSAFRKSRCSALAANPPLSTPYLFLPFDPPPLPLLRPAPPQARFLADPLLREEL